MTYRGQIQNGVVVFQPAVSIPEGSTVDVTVVSNEPKPGRAEGTLYESLKDVIGIVDDMPADSSVNIDHYLYGVPKR
jgi:hypothetical protein